MKALGKSPNNAEKESVGMPVLLGREHLAVSANANDVTKGTLDKEPVVAVPTSQEAHCGPSKLFGK